MLFSYLNTSSLKGRNWHCLELISESAASMEATLSRLVRGIAHVCGSHPLELFVPISQRNLGKFDLSTDSFIFVRSDSIEPLAKLKRITGVSGLLTKGDRGRVEDAITVPDADVQPLIAKARKTEESWSKGIRRGSFVRILDGQCRGYCGHVTSTQPMTVRVRLLTKTLTVETPRSNLLNLPNVPPEHQVFYFSPAHIQY